LAFRSGTAGGFRRFPGNHDRPHVEAALVGVSYVAGDKTMKPLAPIGVDRVEPASASDHPDSL